LSERILQGELSPGDNVDVGFDGTEFTFAVSKREVEPTPAGALEP
jgi:hypothetical protein